MSGKIDNICFPIAVVKMFYVKHFFTKLNFFHLSTMFFQIHLKRTNKISEHFKNFLVGILMGKKRQKDAECIFQCTRCPISGVLDHSKTGEDTVLYMFLEI